MKVLAAIALGLAAPAAAAAAHPAGQGHAHARGVEDPRAFVQAQFDAYRTEVAPEWPEHVYSDRLRGLFAAYDAWARQHDDLVGSLDFDWWINAQDWDLRSVETFEEPEGPDRTTILARFDNSGRVDLNRFKFVRQNGRWYLDDVVNGHRDEEGWVLSRLLQERPD